MMKHFNGKSNYLPPKITAISIVVEAGFAGSNQGVQEIPPPEMDIWNTANNSGEKFWGGSSGGSGGPTEAYSSFEWNW